MNIEVLIITVFGKIILFLEKIELNIFSVNLDIWDLYSTPICWFILVILLTSSSNKYSPLWESSASIDYNPFGAIPSKVKNYSSS